MGTKDEETTLDLDQAMVDGMDKFQGELIEAAREGTEDGGQKTEDGDQKTEVGDQKSEVGEDPKSKESITPKPGDQDSPSKEKEEDAAGTQDKDETPDAKKEEEDAAGTQGKDEGETSDEKKTQFRFKDHEKAEEGYRHQQARTTRIEQEAVRLKKELKTAQDAEKQRETQEKNDKDLLDFMTEEHEKALIKIDELDPEDEGYRNRVSRIWAEKDSSVDIKRRAQSAESRVQSSESKAQGAGEEDAAEGEETPGGNDVWDAVEGRAREAGIDPEDDYFRMACSFTPTEGSDGQKLSFEEQTDFAIQQTKEYHIKQEQQFQDRQKKAAEKKSEEHQEANLPLGRSAADRVEEKPSEPKAVTISDALDGAMEERRL